MQYAVCPDSQIRPGGRIVVETADGIRADPHTGAITREENRMAATSIDWKAIVADPRFQKLHSRKTAFLWGLMVFSVLYYFLLPIGAAYFADLFRIKVFGPVNVGILFALSEFVVAWGIAFYYSKRANAEFDAAAAELIRDAGKIGGQR